eukprot:CAMPEP_0201925774 /NCGR_PEP_ID=MMETSP0903-20130614/14895_1 /ASSEMBLY_ACC=CAM_ASM_000552 /TAXON_ID=420261 /ORGANISM="Thalassiosira antarctica, Strain CCMP982" /LENGTH=199 /DNA_ID=CAMNT_0048463489 /DNA_START=26 /DNA_END=628 /DNA_ORIENTATION=-
MKLNLFQSLIVAVAAAAAASAYALEEPTRGSHLRGVDAIMKATHRVSNIDFYDKCGACKSDSCDGYNKDENKSGGGAGGVVCSKFTTNHSCPPNYCAWDEERHVCGPPYANEEESIRVEYHKCVLSVCCGGGEDDSGNKSGGKSWGNNPGYQHRHDNGYHNNGEGGEGGEGFPGGGDEGCGECPGEPCCLEKDEWAIKM